MDAFVAEEPEVADPCDDEPPHGESLTSICASLITSSWIRSLRGDPTPRAR